MEPGTIVGSYVVEYSSDRSKFIVHGDAGPRLSVIASDGSGLHTLPGVPSSVGDQTWGAAR
jgi:hypothetical protein